MIEENENRRGAYRLEEQVLLKVEKLESSDPETGEAVFNERRAEFGILTHLKYGVEKQLPTMRTIERKHPEIAQYLKFLQHQIQDLSARNSERDSVCKEFGEKQWVELSANGLRFEATGSYTVDQYLLVMVVLTPNDLRIMALATVSRIDVSDDGVQDISVRFTKLHIEDEEALIKHLHKRQIDDLRKEKDD